MKKILLIITVILFYCVSGIAQEAAVMVKDIVPGPNSGFKWLDKYFRIFVSTNDAFYFYINEADGISFWRSDGSSQGTFPLVKFPQSPALGSVVNADESNIKAAVIGNTIYFVGFDEEHGVELWQTDGTISGTKLSLDIAAGPDGSNPSQLYNFNGELLFITYENDEEGNKYSYIRMSEGTVHSTSRIKKLFPNTTYVSDFFVISGPQAFFSYYDINTGSELWKTDGTATGTLLVKDISAGTDSSTPNTLTLIDDLLYFRAESPAYCNEPWVSDGTSAGTKLLKDLVPGTTGSDPYQFIKAAGKVFITAKTPDNSSSSNLYVTDGTSDGTIYLGEQNIADLIAFKEKLYLGYGKSNVIKATAGVPGDIQVIAELPVSYTEFLAATDTVLYFKALDNTHGVELWRTNSTQAGTRLVIDINEGTGNSQPIHAFSLNGNLNFVAFDPAYGQEIWKLEHLSKIISGKIYLDTNLDGVAHEDEAGLNNQKLQILPDDIEIYTNHSGQFNWAAAPGTYTVKVLPSEGWKIAAGPDIYEITIPGKTQAQFGLTQTENRPKVSLQLTSSAASRCGFDVTYWLEYNNTGNLPSDGELRINLAPEATFIESTPVPAMEDNNILQWNYQDLMPGQQRKVLLKVRMPGVNAIGDTLKFYSQATISGTSFIASDTLEQIITCAYDPNDKQVKPAGIEEEHYTLKNSWLDYTIRFQNTGNDTAFTVVLKDTLDLNLSTFEIISSSHNMQASRKDRALEFRFDDILLPDSTTNEPASHGYVRYRIKAKAGVAENTVVENKAYIFFDFNPPIVTNTTFNTLVSTLPQRVVSGLDAIVPLLKLYPNPAEASVNIQAQLPMDEIFLYNSMGQLVYRQLFKNPATNEQLSLQHIPAGIYLLKVRTGSSQLQHRLVKH